jgi:hypothetical protein
MNIGLQANFKKEHVNEKSPVGLMKMRNSAKPNFHKKGKGAVPAATGTRPADL